MGSPVAEAKPGDSPWSLHTEPQSHIKIHSIPTSYNMSDSLAPLSNLFREDDVN